jgi:hypothetical protein
VTANERGPYPDSEWGRYQELHDREEQEYWQDRITGRTRPPRVLSDADAWALVPPSKQADWCGKVPMRATSHADGRAFTFPARPCGSWTHQPCAEKKANLILWHLRGVWSRSDGLFLTSFRTDPIAMVRVRQRRKGQNEPWLWVSRSDGWTHYFGTVALPGRDAPRDWVQLTPATAIELVAACALALPGPERVRAHPQWRAGERKPEKKATRTYTVHGPIDEDRWEGALRQAAEVVRLKYGVAFEPWHDEPLPPEVPVSAWVEEVQTTLINLRGTSRFPHRPNLTNPPPEQERMRQA